MKLYFESRSQARSNKGNVGVVRDCKQNPSINKSRWAVDYSKTKQGEMNGFKS